MNMIIHDDGHTNIITNDGLKNNRTLEIENRNLNFQDGTFDLIMTNPPFGSTIKADEVGYYKEYELFEKNLGFTEIKDRIADDNNKNKWRASQSTEVLFLERCYKYLNEENGYLAIVVPDGILTNSSSQYVRDWLIEKFRILSVVSLPQHTFAHVKAGVKSSILFLKNIPKTDSKFEQTLSDVKALVREEKKLDKEQRAERMLELYKECIFKYSDNYEVLMVEVENIGYDPTGTPIAGNELPEIAKKIQSFILNEMKINRVHISDIIDARRMDPIFLDMGPCNLGEILDWKLLVLVLSIYNQVLGPGRRIKQTKTMASSRFGLQILTGMEC